MEINNLKNIVILRNLPSNMIDEAIIVLKQNVSEKNDVEYNKDFIIKEAESIVSDYIAHIEKPSVWRKIFKKGKSKR